MQRLRGFGVLTAVSALSAAAVVAGVPGVTQAAASGHRDVMGVVHQSATMHASHPTSGAKSSPLQYRGGSVEVAPKVFIVFWGSQWSNDPSNEAGILQGFFNGVGGSWWSGTMTQYCSGVASGSTSCSGGTAITNPKGQLGGAWFDNGAAAPRKPTGSQLAAEAISAASHFGYSANAQYVVATSTGHNSSGFGSSYCAYHSSVSSSLGQVAWTNLPYMTDAGANCGANFNGLGPTAGITIVAGHEYAESVTDPFPSSGWLDGSGQEIGDKCAWISSADITLSTGTFAVQGLWSNSTGGCVT